MTVGSLFAGIGGFDAGFERAGFTTAWQVEQEPFCRAILERHFPDAERFNDVRDCGAANLRPVDVVCAGVPCQDVSVAGKRRGLAGERTGLFYEFARILRELRPAWFVFENVPGLFSSNGGRDFAEVLRVLMVECGYGVAWRVLDSQFFGVAQRRRRVFIVGSFGRPCPAEVLFEPACSGGNPPAGRETGPDIAYALASRAGGTGSDSSGLGNGWNTTYAVTSNMRNRSQGVAAYCLRSSDGHHGNSSAKGDGTDNLVAAPLSAGSFDASHQPGRRREDDFNIVATLNSGGNSGGFRTEPGEHLVAAPLTASFAKHHGRTGGNNGVPYNIVGLGQGGRNHAYEAERTGAIQSKGNSASGNEAGTVVGAPADANGVRAFAGLPRGLDSPRYRALGNAVTVNVGEWIARRIVQAEASNVGR